MKIDNIDIVINEYINRSVFSTELLMGTWVCIKLKINDPILRSLNSRDTIVKYMTQYDYSKELENV